MADVYVLSHQQIQSILDPEEMPRHLRVLESVSPETINYMLDILPKRTSVAIVNRCLVGLVPIVATLGLAWLVFDLSLSDCAWFAPLLGALVILLSQVFKMRILRELRNSTPIVISCIVACIIVTMIWGRSLIPVVFPPQVLPVSEVVITATGKKSASALSSEVWFRGALLDGKPVDVSQYTMDPPWERRDDAFVSFQKQPASIVLRGAFDGPIDLLFLSHPWSGNITIAHDGQTVRHNLFAPEERAGIKSIRINTGPQAPKALSLAGIALGAASTLPGALLGLCLARRRARTVLMLLLPLLPVLWAAIAAAPGLYTPDSMNQLRQALSSYYSDWNPPLMAGVWSWLIKLSGEPEALFWFHLGLLAFGLLGWARALQMSYPRSIGVLFLSIGALSPAVLNFAGVIWKDVGFAFALIAASSGSALLSIYARQEDGKVVVLGALFALVMLCLFYAVGVRVNGLLAVIPILALGVHSLLPRSQNLISRGIAIVTMTVLGTGALWYANQITNYRILNSIKSNPEQYILLHDLVGIGVQTGHIRIPKAFQSEVYTPQAVIDNYTAYSGNYLVYTVGGKSPPLLMHTGGQSSDYEAQAELRRVWLGEIAEAPKAYLMHRSAVFMSLLRINEPNPYFHRVSFSEKPAEGTRLPGEAKAKDLLTRSILWWEENTVIFMGWFWALMLVVLAVSGIFYRKHIEGQFILMLSASGLAYLLPYFVVAPASDFRYLYWCVLAATISAVIAFSILARRALSWAVQSILATNFPALTRKALENQSNK